MFIGFSFNNSNLFSKLIGWFTKSQWSHCFIVVAPIGEDDHLIVEAAFHGGIKFNLLSKYKKPNINLQLIPVIANDINCLLPFIGNNYGWKQILGYVIAKALKLKTNPITDDMVCSELVYLWLINHPYYRAKFMPYTSNDITPQDIFKELS